MTLLTYFLFGCAFLILSAFFSSMETALFSLSVAERHKLTRKSSSLKWIFLNLNTALIAILFANTFVNIGFSLSIDEIFSQLIGHHTLSVITSILAATLLVLIWGEIMPKNFAIFHRTLLAGSGSRILRIVISCLKPVTLMSQFLVMHFVNRMKKWLPQAYPRLMKDELLTLAGLQRKKSFLNMTEKFLLQNITKLSQLKASEIVTPRVKTKMIDLQDPENIITGYMKKYKHKLMPAYRGSIDNIIGIIDVKDCLIANDSVVNHIQKPYFIPESKKVLSLMQEMKEKNIPMAVVVDEYGGFAGIITMEDIVEEVVGDISDEFDPHERLIQKSRTNTYIVSGDAKLEDVRDITRFHIDGDPSDTINAFLLNKCGDIPKKGYQYKVSEEVILIVLRASKRKVLEVEIRTT